MKYITISILLIIVILFSCNPLTERIDSYEVHGIDISHHQSNVRWDTVALQNINFAFIKATEGQDFRDSLFCYNWEEMERTQIKRGAYHFFRPKIDAALQAQNFIDLVDLKRGDLPPVLDIEVLDGSNRQEMVKNIKVWLQMVEDNYNITPIIYTNLKFYYNYIAGNFDKYPIWIARYSPHQPVLAYGNRWTFWQYGNKGRIRGIEGDVDLNVFHGNLLDLEEMSCTDYCQVNLSMR